MKKILFFLLLPFSILAQTPDATIKTNTNNLIRNSTNVTRANHSLINDQITDSKESRIRPFIASGTNTYTVTIPYVTSYLFGLTVYVQFTNANSGTSTINITGASGSPLGAKTLKKSVLTDLVTGDILAGEFKELWYDGTNFQVRGSGGGGGGSASWGGITGTLSSQTDLQNALNLKQDESIVVSSNTTAVNDAVYTVVASATFTDPSPVEGKGFTVFIRNGTGTVGGTGYSIAGTKITRIFHSGSWANYTGGGGISGLTSGRVTFATSGTTIGDDANLIWDNINKSLGIGTIPSPSYGFHLKSQQGMYLEATIGASVVTRFQKNSGLFSGFDFYTGASTRYAYIISFPDESIHFTNNADEGLVLHQNGGISINGITSPNASTALDIQGTTKAFKIGSALRSAITTPVSGHITNESNVPYFHNGTAWSAIPTNTAANTELMMSDGTNAVPSGVFSPASGAISGTQALAANTYGAGLTLSNVTAATSGNQRYSPSIILTGQGWKTNATAASQQTDIRITSVPVEGSANPNAQLLFERQVNGTGYGQLASLYNFVAGGDSNFGLSLGDDLLQMTGNTTLARINAPTSELSLNGTNISLFDLGSFGGGQKVIFFQNSTTNPSTSVTGGGVMYVKSSDSKPYWWTGTTEYAMTGASGTYYAPSTLVANATDANFTATVNGVHNILDGVASTNRVITIPTGANGDVMKFYNTEDTRVWSFTGATVYLADRVTVVTELLYNVPCHMERIDGRWIITN